jgi:hypothetical protein
LSLIHLLIEIPRYGAYAIRDASFILEGIFLLLGFLWSRRANDYDVVIFLKAVGLIFVINFVYSWTFPISLTLKQISPVSGIFLQVPLLGFYNNTSFFLISGALFYIFVAKWIIKWPYIMLLTFALLQVSWSFVFQARSMYVGIIVVLLIIIFLGEVHQGIKLAAVFACGLIILFLGIGILEINIKGRIGEIKPEFFVQHFQSIFLKQNTPGEGSVAWRLEILNDIWERWKSSNILMVIGEGFGKPLTHFSTAEGVVVRQPHNTHFTILMRLGIIGSLFWFLLNLRIFTLFIKSLKNTRKKTFNRDLFHWFFLFYILGMLLTSVQPWLEFSFGSIPFFMMIGFALGMMRKY